jgi:hypothetical protein
MPGYARTDDSKHAKAVPAAVTRLRDTARSG